MAKQAKSLVRPSAKVDQNVNTNPVCLFDGTLPAWLVPHVNSAEPNRICTKTQSLPVNPRDVEKCQDRYYLNAKGDKVAVSGQNYVSTGLFLSNEGKRDEENLIKVAAGYYDIDLADIACGKGTFPADLALKAQLLTMWDTAVAEGKLNKAGYQLRSDIDDEHKVKGALLVNPSEGKKIAEVYATKFLDMLDSKLGLKPNRVVYTGGGFHAQFFIADKDGWTASGVETMHELCNVANVEAPEMVANAHIFCSSTKVEGGNKVAPIHELVDKLGMEVGVKIDTAVTDWGTRIGRYSFDGNVAENAKLRTSVVTVEQILTSRNHDEPLTSEMIEAALGKHNKTVAVVEVPKTKKIKTVDEDKAVAGTYPEGEKITFDRGLSVTAQELFELVQDEKKLADLLSSGQVEYEDRRQDEHAIVPLKFKNARHYASTGSFNGWVNFYDVGGSYQRMQIMFTTQPSRDYFKAGYDAGEKGYFISDKGNACMKFEYRGSVDKVFKTLERNQYGKVLGSAKNARALFSADTELADVLYYDATARQVYCSTKVLTWLNPDLVYGHADALGVSRSAHSYTPITDLQEDAIALYLSTKFGMQINRKGFAEIKEIVASSSKVRLDLIDHIKGFNLRWKLEGKEQLVDTWLCTILGTKKGTAEYALLSEYGRVWIGSLVVSACAGTGISIDDEIDLGFSAYPYLLGKQGAGKSLLAKKLALTEMSSIPKNITSRLFGETSDILEKSGGDRIKALAGKILIEIAEAGSATRKHVEAVKSFLTTKVDEGRQAYDKEYTRAMRRAFCVFTVNDSAPFADSTGNRRFMSINTEDKLQCPTGKVDLSWFSVNGGENLQKLYGEAYARFVVGTDINPNCETSSYYGGRLVESWLLNPKFYALQQADNERYRAVTGFELFLAEYINKHVAAGSNWTVVGRQEAIMETYGERKVKDTLTPSKIVACFHQAGLVSGKSGVRYWKPSAERVIEAMTATQASVSAVDEINIIDAAKQKIAQQEAEIAELKAKLAKFMAGTADPVAVEVVEPKAVEPKAVEPKAVEPKAVEPKAVETKAVEVVEPKAVEVLEPKVATQDTHEAKPTVSSKVEAKHPIEHLFTKNPLDLDEDKGGDDQLDLDDILSFNFSED